MSATASNPVFPFHLVRADLDCVEKAICEQARAFDPGVEGYVAYASAPRSQYSRAVLPAARMKGTPAFP